PMKHSIDGSFATFSPDGKMLGVAVGDFNPTAIYAYIFDSVTGKTNTPPLQHDDAIWCINFSPDNRLVATGSRDHTARLWDAHTGKILTPPIHHAGAVNYAVFSDDSRWLATFSDDATARLWDAQTGEPLTPPFKHPGPVMFGRFLAEGKYLFSQCA